MMHKGSHTPGGGKRGWWVGAYTAYLPHSFSHQFLVVPTVTSTRNRRENPYDNLKTDKAASAEAERYSERTVESS